MPTPKPSPAANPGVGISRSKSLPYYQSKIGPSLTPASRRLLEEYSAIPPPEVEQHIYKIRDIAWEVFPWPCIGGFWFVNLGLSLHPAYPALLSRLRSSPTPTKFLDLGTCLGQDLRKLAFDGVPVRSLYGSDVFADYERVGHELFRDGDRFQDRFIAADLFEEDADKSALVSTEGSWDVISIVMFLHIYDWETQIWACKRILKLLARKPGSMVVGALAGSTLPGEQVVKPPLVPEGQEKTIYRQSRETFVEMWSVVEKEEGVNLKVEVVYDDLEDRERRARESEGAEKKKNYFGAEQRRLYFTVEVI